MKKNTIILAIFLVIVCVFLLSCKREHHAFPYELRAYFPYVENQELTFRVNVEKLGFGDRIHVKDIELPAGITCGLDPETLLFHVVAPQEETVAEPAENAPTEPEAIKQKAPAAEEEADGDKADKKKK